MFHQCRYSVTLSKSALKRAANSSSGPQRYKRLLSVSLTSDHEENGRQHRRQRKKLESRKDLETGQLQPHTSDDSLDSSSMSDHLFLS